MTTRYGGITVDPLDQPDLDTKLRVLRGEGLQEWDYLFTVPPVCHDRWDAYAWITYIGDNWFRNGV